MRMNAGALWLEFPHDLVDEALIAASQSAPADLRRQFLEERDAVNSIEIVDIREESFRLLDARWAERLRLGAPLVEALRERDGLTERIAGCSVERVRTDADERATLQTVNGEARPILCLTIRVETLLSRGRLREVLSGVA